MYPEAPTTQNFASCVQLCRWRSAWVARARRPGATAASRCSMTVGEPSDSGGCSAFRSEPERPVVRKALAAVEDDGQEAAVRSEGDVAQRAEAPLLPRDRLAAQRGQRECARSVEPQLVLLQQHERRVDRQAVGPDRRRRQRKEAVHLVAAEDVEPDHAQGLSVQQQAGRPAELDAVQPQRQREDRVSRQLLHVAAIVPGPGGQKPSSPTRGTKRQGTDLITAGPSGLRTITSSRWMPNRPTGTTSRPRGSSCSDSVCGRRGAAAATAIASKGARSGRPRVPSPTCTRTRSYPAAARFARARSASSGIRSIVSTSAASSASTAAW